MTYSNKLTAHYLELAKLPINEGNFAGDDVRYSSEYEVLENELGKATALHETAAIDWQKVRENSEILLSAHSKDLRVASWLIWGLYQRESFPGLQAGFSLLHYLCLNHWAELHPRKPRTRAAAISWLTPRLEQALAEHVPIGEQLALFRSLAEQLRALEACLAEHLGEDAPLLLPLCRRLDELVKRASQGQPEPGSVGAAIAQVKQAASQMLTPGAPIENEKEAHKSLRSLQDQARPLCAYWLKQKASDLRALRYQNGQYADLLVDLEASIARAPFWLDGQHLVWQCLHELDAEQAMREVEIQLALFMQRMSGLEELRFHDGSAFADAQTRAWLSSHVMPHVQAPASDNTPVATDGNALPAWDIALQETLPKLRKDGLKSAVQQLKLGLAKARGGRERFFWQLTLARLCYSAKKYELAKTQLESLDQTLQATGLGDWEPDLALDVLRMLHSCCELLPQNHAVRESKEEIYRRLCHLDLEVVLD